MKLLRQQKATRKSFGPMLKTKLCVLKSSVGDLKTIDNGIEVTIVTFGRLAGRDYWPSCGIVTV